MKITILVDNTKGICPAEHGFSALVEGDEKVLFDTGASDLFLKNAKQLGVDLNDVKIVALSHGHYDHGDGLHYMKDKTLICHPGCFGRERHDKEGFNGMFLSLKEAQSKFDVKASKEPYWISDSIVFLGEIPRENDFENQEAPYFFLDGSPDFIIDDSALAIKTDKGLVIITGCGHSGLCNTIEYSKKVTGINKIYAVLGGFHLRKINDVMGKTFEYLKNENINYLYTGHCTIPEIQDKMVDELGAIKLESGIIINF